MQWKHMWRLDRGKKVSYNVRGAEGKRAAQVSWYTLQMLRTIITIKFDSFVFHKGDQADHKEGSSKDRTEWPY